MRHTVYGFLSRQWAGLAIAATCTLAGLLLVQAFEIRSDSLRQALTALVVLVGALLALGAMRQWLNASRAWRANPAPGQLIDVGGYSLHVLAEGEARGGRPGIVWFAGGHGGGFLMHHLHCALRGETRSILIDRPGTGWSDIGPFPRTTAREADEVVQALEGAGEKGPFIWAGHSFGGLLCANIARRRPELVHTLVLLDPTPLETIVFGPRLSALKRMRQGALWAGLAQLFGVDLAASAERRPAADPALDQLSRTFASVLGPALATLRRIEARPGVRFAQASIYEELCPEGVAACAWDTVVYDGDLGDLPVLLVAPMDASDVERLPEANSGDAANAQRMVRFFGRTRERYLATSSRSRRVVAPPGTGHNFIYEVPGYVVEVMRGLLESSATR